MYWTLKSCAVYMYLVAKKLRAVCVPGDEDAAYCTHTWSRRRYLLHTYLVMKKKTEHCMVKATMSMTIDIGPRSPFVSSSFIRPGTRHVAFMRKSARMTSNCGSTLKTKRHTPNVCDASVTKI